MSIRPVIDSTLPTIQRDACAIGSADPCAGFWGQNGLSFQSLVDTVNPLQHIPVVSTLYHAMTGDTGSTGANLAGGALYGGPIGFAGAIVTAMITGITGSEPGASLLAQVTGKSDSSAQVADNSAAPSGYTPSSMRSGMNAYLSAQSLLG